MAWATCTSCGHQQRWSARRGERLKMLRCEVCGGTMRAGRAARAGCVEPPSDDEVRKLADLPGVRAIAGRLRRRESGHDADLPISTPSDPLEGGAVPNPSSDEDDDAPYRRGEMPC